MSLTTETINLTLAGESFEIRPFFWTQLPKVARTLAVIKETMPSFAKLNDEGGVDLDILALYAVHADNINELLAMAISKPVYFLSKLTQEEGVGLLLAVIQANKDELEKKVKPALSKIVPALAAND